MNKTADQMREEAKKDIASVVKRITEVAHAAVANLTEAEIAEGFAKCSAEAPQWTRLVERVVGSAARSETQKPATVNNSLALVIVGKAESTESWQEQAKKLQAMEKAKRLAEAIDVPAVPATKREG